ncbi:MAG: 3-isopropylmalate dehydrogenase [Armatimonadetes bacterium]|nr:3-isopropylmalate dehydrogenase [Armatimonadota bacterium]
MYKIAVLPCDGVGPEVVAEGLKVLAAACRKHGVNYQTITYDIGAERYLRTGELITDTEMEELSQVDAIYLGAVGHPDVPPGVLEHGILLRLRFEFDQYINLRPVKLYPGVPCPLVGKGPQDIDFVVVRENTEDLYVGVGGTMRKGTPEEIATQTAIYTRRGTERVIRYAFDLARRRAKDKKVTLVDKANVLTYGHDLWRRTFAEVAQEYPDVATDYAFVDACCMWMVKNPEWFDVIVTTNMFGDIITDLGAIIQGGLGVAAGGNINPNGVSMFEPIHGSAPKHAGKGVACPIAAILAAAMMMDVLGEEKVAAEIESAVEKALASGRFGDLSTSSGVRTSEYGDAIVEIIETGSAAE